MQSGSLRGSVRAVDHTADLAIEIHSSSLESLFDLAARGMRALVECDDDDAALAALPNAPLRHAHRGDEEDATHAALPGTPARHGSRSDDEDTALAVSRDVSGQGTSRVDEVAEAHTIELRADDLPTLLLLWLRDLLYRHQVEGVGYESSEFEQLDERTLRAVIHGTTGARVVRELKGVTYHDLAAGPRDGGWFGRVIFDV
jgi:SHS2 domain-containing protein